MKKYIAFLILSTLIQCQSQKINTMIPVVDKKFEKFDVEDFNKNSSRGLYVIKKENFVIIRNRVYLDFLKTNKEL